MKEIRYYHENSPIVAYRKVEDLDGSFKEYTYDGAGNNITYNHSDGSWTKSTYNKNGDKLTLETSEGFSSKTTYDEENNVRTYQNSNGVYKIGVSFVSKEEFEKFHNPRPCIGKKVTIDGVEYILN